VRRANAALRETGAGDSSLSPRPTSRAKAPSAEASPGPAFGAEQPSTAAANTQSEAFTLGHIQGAVGMGENLVVRCRRALAREPREQAHGATRPSDQDSRNPHGDPRGFRPIAISFDPEPGGVSAGHQAREKRLRRNLPPSYRAFLQLHDGWPRFFGGASLLGTANLGHRKYEDLARAAFEAAETPVPDLGPPRRPRARSLIPFGADLDGTTLFAFNPAVVQPDGEYEG